MAERWVLSSLILVVLSLSMVVITAANIPALFILGDSTADVGTNNYRDTFAKANFPYNGIDFSAPPSKPTGRFSNGLNSADTLSMQMGFRRSPSPFLALMKKKSGLDKAFIRGANFASGASGILPTTGSSFGKVVSMGEQIHQVFKVRSILTSTWGVEPIETHLAKSVFLISVGSNDIFEYFAVKGTADKELFIGNLTSAYVYQLRMLYAIGARKIGIVSVPAIGCCPSQRALNTTGGGCLEDLNEYSRMFYSSLQDSLEKLSPEYKDLKYSLGNTYEMMTNFMENPLPFGFKELNTACCGNGTFNGQAPCTPKAKLCPNRDEYLFWDMYHPTQAAAKLAALTLYGGGTKFVTPINFMQLANE